MRHYEPLWKQLKEKGRIRVAVPKALHRRTIKAVMKERCMDLGFRFMLSENSQRCWIQYRSEENIIHMWLKYSIGESDL
jgi:hypothetical protein